MKLKTAIVGATGYTGSELVRILHYHPGADIRLITSETHQGKAFSDIHSHFKGIADITLKPASALEEEELDFVFLALPHGVSMDFVLKYKDSGFRIIDLSGDFRLESAERYEKWYGKAHVFPAGFDSAVYGLPEINREAIQKATLVANPGCYPTSSILGVAPQFDAGLVDSESVIIDAKSGVTGAGVKAKPTTHYSSVSDNFKAYGLKNHRHTAEIEENLSALGSAEATVQFTPHLLPVDRGILATIYTEPEDEVSDAELFTLYSDYYRDEPFVRIRETPPTLKDVRGSNYCDIFTTYDERTGRIITLSVIDNLVKGAAGQAVQNMNIMAGLNEEAGFYSAPMNP